jgi:ribonuclease P protein component
MIHTVTVRKNNDFIRAYRKARYYTGQYIVLYVLRETDGNPEKNALGVTASRKTGKSVRRNRLKRLVKENYRLMEGYIRIGFIIIFVIRAQNGEMPDFHAMGREMRGLLSRAGVFDGERWENSRQRA